MLTLFGIIFRTMIGTFGGIHEEALTSFLGAQASRLLQERAGSPRSQEAIHWRRTCEMDI